MIKILSLALESVATKVDLFNAISNLITPLDNDIADSLLKREKIVSTGVGLGIAIPHTVSEYVNEPTLVFIRLNEAMEFDAIDEKLVDLVFAIFVPKGEEEKHLPILSRLAGLLLDSDLVLEFRQKDLDYLVNILKEGLN